MHVRRESCIAFLAVAAGAVDQLANNAPRWQPIKRPDQDSA